MLGWFRFVFAIVRSDRASRLVLPFQFQSVLAQLLVDSRAERDIAVCMIAQ